MDPVRTSSPVFPTRSFHGSEKNSRGSSRKITKRRDSQTSKNSDKPRSNRGKQNLEELVKIQIATTPTKGELKKSIQFEFATPETRSPQLNSEHIELISAKRIRDSCNQIIQKHKALVANNRPSFHSPKPLCRSGVLHKGSSPFASKIEGGSPNHISANLGYRQSIDCMTQSQVPKGHKNIRIQSKGEPLNLYSSQNFAHSKPNKSFSHYMKHATGNTDYDLLYSLRASINYCQSKPFDPELRELRSDGNFHRQELVEWFSDFSIDEIDKMARCTHELKCSFDDL
jgi:hypothetical protein